VVDAEVGERPAVAHAPLTGGGGGQGAPARPAGAAAAVGVALGNVVVEACVDGGGGHTTQRRAVWYAGLARGGRGYRRSGQGSDEGGGGNGQRSGHRAAGGHGEVGGEGGVRRGEVGRRGASGGSDRRRVDGLQAALRSRWGLRTAGVSCLVGAAGEVWVVVPAEENDAPIIEPCL